MHLPLLPLVNKRVNAIKMFAHNLQLFIMLDADTLFCQLKLHIISSFYYVRCRRAVLSAEAAYNLQLFIMLDADAAVLSAEAAHNLQLLLC